MNATYLLLLLRRIAAFLYDSLLLFALFFFVTGIAIQFNEGKAIQSSLYPLLLLPVAGLFFLWFWINGGQTLGMRAWRIKLVNNEGQNPSLRACVVRVVTGTLLFGVSYLYACFDTEGKTLHDRLSLTQIDQVKIYKN